MTNLFFHGFKRMSDLLQKVQDPVLRARAYEALECMSDAFDGKSSRCEDLEKQLERMQKRYNKLKGEKYEKGRKNKRVQAV